MKVPRVIDIAGNMAAAGLNTVFPPACPQCGLPDESNEAQPSLCDECADPLMLPLSEMCPCCAMCINRLAIRDGRCPQCRDRRFAYDRILCLGPYRGELGAAIVRMKHLAEQPLTFAMGRLIGWRLLGELDQLPDLLVPMPMHWRRRIRRGSNTAEILADAIHSVCDISLQLDLLRTTRLTQKQSLLSPHQRQANVRNAFAVKRPGLLKTPVKIHVGLVDDTVTTGATANAAARVLRKAGAAQVTVLAVARANK